MPDGRFIRDCRRCGKPTAFQRRMLRVCEDCQRVTSEAAKARRKAHAIPIAVQCRVRALYLNCFYCGDPPQRRLFANSWEGPVALTLDHMVPLEMGGTSVEANLVMACESCNKSKGPRPVARFAWDLHQRFLRYDGGAYGVVD